MATSTAVKPSAEASSEMLENRDDAKSEALDSTTGKSLLEANGFRVVKKIGSGSYSKVKLAISDNHKAMVAIKIVSKFHVPDEFLRKFLYSEVKVVKFLKHENIIKYYQSLESSHRLYVVMQFAHNGSILDLIHKERRLTEARACNFFRQIVAGLEYCHSQGVAHRDIKCENILLDENFVVKLIDFGFAKSFRDTPKSTGQERLETAISDLTKAVDTPKADKNARLCETYCGSYAYASPEILKGIPYDPFTSDVWAMGCVLYAMVVGRLPFDDRKPAKLIRQVQSPVNFPSSIEVSEGFKSLIRKILAPLKSRATIDDIKNDDWFNTAYLKPSQTIPPRKLSTR